LLGICFLVPCRGYTFDRNLAYKNGWFGKKVTPLKVYPKFAATWRIIPVVEVVGPLPFMAYIFMAYKRG